MSPRGGGPFLRPVFVFFSKSVMSFALRCALPLTLATATFWLGRLSGTRQRNLIATPGPPAQLNAQSGPGPMKIADWPGHPTEIGWAESPETSDPRELSAWVSSIRNARDRAEYICRTLQRLAEEAPEAALPFAIALAPSNLRSPAIVQALEILATSGHGPEALAQADHLLSSTSRHAARLGIVAGWSRYAPEAAMNWATTLPDKTESASASEIVIAQWGSADPTAALRWLDERPYALEWDQLITGVSAAWASAEPQSALEWARAQSVANPDSPNPIITVYQEWSQADPAAAGKSLISEEASIQRTNAAALAKVWAETDPIEAAAWVRRIGDPVARRASTEALAALETEATDTETKAP